MSDGLVSVYTDAVNQSNDALTQQRALQLIFDVRFLKMVIPRKDLKVGW